jgi:hypothetical protein
MALRRYGVVPLVRLRYPYRVVYGLRLTSSTLRFSACPCSRWRGPSLLNIRRNENHLVCALSATIPAFVVFSFLGVLGVSFLTSLSTITCLSTRAPAPIPGHLTLTLRLSCSRLRLPHTRARRRAAALSRGRRAVQSVHTAAVDQKQVDAATGVHGAAAE